jgi:hypothetical protein
VDFEIVKNIEWKVTAKENDRLYGLFG